ncbi:MAG: glycosyltransferase, partial [Verrucomicrobium sp.]
RPVVANRVGGIPSVVEDGETGLLVENENPAAMAQAIQTLLEDPERLRAMGQRARERAEERFGFPAYVKQHVQWYEEASRPSVSA